MQQLHFAFRARRILLLGLLSLCSLGWGRELKDVEFARPQGESLTLDAWIPEVAPVRGAVVLVHGGGWEAGDKQTYIRPWFTALREAKIPWFSINYRLGPRWKHPAAVEDIEAGVRWVQANAKRWGIDPRKIVLMGESAGGHLAALAALRGRVQVAGLVGFYGIYDIPQWVRQRGGLPKNIGGYLADQSPKGLEEASPQQWLKNKRIPMLLVHGSEDKGVPWQQSEAFCQAARNAALECELQVVQGAPHGVENWEQETRFHLWKPKLRDWLHAHLR